MIKVNYINLNERNDRKKNIEKLFNKSKIIKLNRFNAIKNKNPRIGCYLSHIKLLQEAKEKKEKYVCIIEDDFYTDYINIFEVKLNNILSSKELFDVLLFGGNILPNYKEINNDCAQIFHSQTTTGYYVANHYFDKLLNHLKRGMILLMKNPDNFKHFSIDKYWVLLQKYDKWLIIFPLIVYQKEDYSNIENRIVNYKDIMLDSEKKYLSL